MKNRLLMFMLSLSLYNCNGQKMTKSEIVYFLPFQVKEQIAEKLKTLKDTNGIYFTLENDDAGNYVIFLDSSHSREYQFWIKNTNRTIYINEKFYPLVFKTDEIFSYPENKESIFKKIRNKKYIKKSVVIRDNVFQVKFKANGEIIQ